MTTLTITRPDDWHLHLRDGEMLKGILPETTRHFGRAIIMPNLVPPVITARDAAEYRDRIMIAAAQDHPQYGWESNKGYGSKHHMEALRLHGPTPLHRHSFAPVAQAALL